MEDGNILSLSVERIQNVDSQNMPLFSPNTDQHHNIILTFVAGERHFGAFVGLEKSLRCWLSLSCETERNSNPVGCGSQASDRRG